MTLPTGNGQGRPFKLRPWQRTFIDDVYGPRSRDGRRLVRTAVLSMARKNGKTQLAAGLALCHLVGPEAVVNGEIVSAANDRDQAAQVYKYARQMVELEPELSAVVTVIESTKRLVCYANGSVYRALSAEAGTKHGLNPTVVIFDELAQARNRDLYDVLETSLGAQPEPLMVVIGTQARSPHSPMSELIDYGLRVREGTVKDDTFVLHLYAAPDDADAWDEQIWKMANPALGDFRSLAEMRKQARKARELPSAEHAFRNLYLNQRVGASAPLISPLVWALGAGAPDDSVFARGPVYGGLDLSGRADLTALVLVARDAEGVVHVRPHFFVPEDGVAARARVDRVPYDVWLRQGLLTATPGKTVDYGFVAHRLAEIAAECDLRAVRYDRWRIDDLRRELEAIGANVPLVEHGQGFKDMSPAVEEFEALAANGGLRHGGHPVLTWNAANAVAVQDAAGNRKLDKAKSTGRIDGLVALVMAVRAMTGDDNGDRGGMNDFFASLAGASV